VPQHERDLAQFRSKLWRLLKKEGDGLTAQQAISALQAASQGIWDTTIDSEWKTMSRTAQDRIADAFDITWMTAFALKLRKMKKSSLSHRASRRRREPRG
jgi:hypothetical protein